MSATPFVWESQSLDQPVSLLHRRRVTGERMLVAQVKLEKGCVVASHFHESEQIAMVMSGKVLWHLGPSNDPDARTLEMGGGEVLVIPSNTPHGVTALEDTEIIDVLSPPGPMGVDAMKIIP